MPKSAHASPAPSEPFGPVPCALFAMKHVRFWWWMLPNE
ncbi:Uncharacterised protein [Mycobacteroides abscessus]|nr:Uncharacterised protein [Mycobacteroides abscessus]